MQSTRVPPALKHLRATVSAKYAVAQSLIATIRNTDLKNRSDQCILIHMLTLRQLRYLDALARHEHFGRAAEECAVS